MTSVMSFVDVSPSMLSILNVSQTPLFSAFLSISGEIAVSVVMKQSIVAMFGWIIPEPFAMPPIRHSTPPHSKE